jgi:hypothetical protein
VNAAQTRVTSQKSTPSYLSITLSQVGKNTVQVDGKSNFPKGTPVWIHVGMLNPEPEVPVIHLRPLEAWQTVVQQGGIIHSSNDVSWLPGGTQTIYAYVDVFSRNGNDFSPFTVHSNPIKINIHHNDVGVDVRSYYQPGTPAYTVADFVYLEHTDPNRGGPPPSTANDVVPWEQSSIHLYGYWPDGSYVLDGVDIYHVRYVTKTSALADTRLLAEFGESLQMTMHQYVGGPPDLLYYTFKLSKIKGKWRLDVQDLQRALIQSEVGLYRVK